MANETTTGYTADIEKEWVPLSHLNAKHAERIEEYLSRYIKGDRNVPRIAIVGPYGQGKTQLLFHILKKTFEKGAIALYTHADIIVKFIVQQFGQNGKILPSDLPTLLRKAIVKDLKNIQLGKFENLILTHPDVAQWTKEHLPDTDSNSPLVLLIDELEQAYETLQSKIESSDRNPIRGLLDSREVYAILAFAPRSIYEYKMGASFGEGEAERRRLDVFNLPPVSAAEIKNFLGIDERGFANFIWWLSRGRAGLAIKAFNNSRDYALVEQAGFQSFVESLGHISGVSCLDSDAFMDKQGNFFKEWNMILNITPCAYASEEDWALNFHIDKELDLNANNFFGKLGFSGKHAIILSGFLRLLLDAISDGSGKSIIKKRDSITLIRATYELALEHTYDEDLISTLQSKLDELQTNPDLKFSLPDKMEEARISQRSKSLQFLPFDLEKLLECFPFPLSSPQLPGTTDKEVKKWLREVSGYPLAEDTEGSVNILFFVDLEQFKRYTENSRRSFVEKSLPEKNRTLVVLLQGEASSLPAVAQCLKKQGRLEIQRLRPSLLAGFLANALFLVSQYASPGPARLRKELENLQKQFANQGDRATVRKVQHYAGGLNEFVVSGVHSFGASTKKFAYERKGAGFEEQFGRQKASAGFFYPFVLAFFKEDLDGGRALASLRSFSERPGDPLQVFLPELGGFRTAVRFLPTADRKGVLQNSESVAVIKDFYEDLANDLEELAGLLSKDEFILLVDDDLSRFLLGAFHDAKKFNGVNEAAKRMVVDYLEQSLEIQKKILTESQIIRESIGIGVDSSLKFSPEQEVAIAELKSIVERVDSWNSLIYQEVFSVFAEQISIGTKANADGFWKSLNAIPSLQYRQLKELKDLFSLPDTLSDGVFRLLGLSRDGFAKTLEKMREEAYEKMSDNGITGLNENNLIGIHECFTDLIELQESIKAINITFESLKEELSRYNEIRRGT
jgi:hypothetical protein